MMTNISIGESPNDQGGISETMVESTFRQIEGAHETKRKIQMERTLFISHERKKNF